VSESRSEVDIDEVGILGCKEFDLCDLFIVASQIDLHGNERLVVSWLRVRAGRFLELCSELKNKITEINMRHYPVLRRCLR
jgi:hypothetical protein